MERVERAVRELAVRTSLSSFVRICDLAIAFPWASAAEWKKLIRLGRIRTRKVSGARMRVVSVADVLRLVDDVETLDALKLERLIDGAKRLPRNAAASGARARSAG